MEPELDLDQSNQVEHMLLLSVALYSVQLRCGPALLKKSSICTARLA